MQILNKSESFFDVIDLIVTPVILANDDGEHLYFNKAFAAHIGYRLEDVPGQTNWFKKAFPAPDYRNEMMDGWDNIKATNASGGRYLHLTARIYCADGMYKWFDIYEGRYGELRVINFLDIDKLEERNHLLTDISKQKDMLLSIIAHDVRPPLNNLKQIVDNYKSLNLCEQEMEEIFFAMGTQVDYVFNFINSLLVHTSDDKGSFIVKREPIHLRSAFFGYRDYYKERMDKQHLEFVVKLPDDAIVNFAPFILDVICRNLIDNAIRYSPDHGRILVSFERTETTANLVISDNGPALSETQIERILNNSNSLKFNNQITDSLGLGLVMAKEILEKYEGKLSIQSEPGRGTSFFVTLPLE